MGTGDKMKHKAEEVKGRVKDAVGDATDNDSLQAKGRAEERKGQTKQVGDQLKDAAHDAKDAATKNR